MSDDPTEHEVPSQADVRAENDRLRLLVAASRELAEAGPDRARALDALVRAVARRPGDACAVLQPAPDGAAFELVAAHPAAPAALAPDRTGPIGQVHATGEAALAEAAGGRRCALAPLRAGGEVLGVVEWSRERDHAAFTADDVALLQELADLAALALVGASRVERLEQALHGRDELLTALAHDMRSPLGVVTINGSLVQRWAGSAPADERISGAADNILRAARRIDEQLGEALDAVKIDRGTFRVELARRSIRGLIARAIEAATPTARQRRVELAALPLADDLHVVCDEARVLQLLASLIDRALRSTPAAGRITVAAAPRGEHVRVEVADTGSAFAADVAARVFARARQTAGRAGVNLGLLLARGIVEAHGGAIGVDSEAGRGSTFHFTLPAAPDAR